MVIASWSLGPEWSQSFTVTLGYASIDVGFAITAVLLAAQEDQNANALLCGCVALSALGGHLIARDVGILAPLSFLLAQLTLPLAGALILRYPHPRFGPLARRWAQVNIPAALLLGILYMLTSRPEQSYADPGNWWLNPWLNEQLSARVAVIRAAWRALAAATFIALMAARWRRLGRVERRTLIPILGAATAAALIIAAEIGRGLLAPPVVYAVSVARSYLGVLVAVAFVMSALRMRLEQSAVAGLAKTLAGPTTHEGLRSALRIALSDPALDVAYWVPERSVYVDGHGLPTSSSDGERRLVLQATDRAGEPLAIITIEPSLERHHDLIGSALAVSVLALENVRLQAGLRAQLAEMTLARSRLLTSGLAQRRQLERDLHDGAQQRLFAIGMHLSSLELRVDDPGTTQVIRLVKAELLEALAELRDLAHGIYPASLAQGGLHQALAAVAARLPLTVHLDVPARRWAQEVEGVAYLVVCEALTNVVKHAETNTAEVTVSDAEGELRIVIRDHGKGWPVQAGKPSLPDLSDRLSALGGWLKLGSGPSGTKLVAGIPVPPTDPLATNAAGHRM